MSDLEQAIADWRLELFLAGIEGKETLDELESHLREEIARQSGMGLNKSYAFELAVQKLGQSLELKEEFAKADALRRAPLHNLFLATAVLNALLGIFWAAMGAHSVHQMIHLLPLHIKWDLGDLRFLAFSWSLEIFAGICGLFAIIAAIQTFRQKRSGIRVTAIISALTVLGVVVNIAWRFMDLHEFNPMVDGVLLGYPIFIFVLCQKADLKEYYA